MVNEAAISEAINDLKSQKKPNFRSTAKKHGINRTTLQRRFEGTSAGRTQAHVETQGLLSTEQERTLVERINTHASRGVNTTSKMIQKLVEEMIEGPVGNHWVPRFVRRHHSKRKQHLSSELSVFPIDISFKSAFIPISFDLVHLTSLSFEPAECKINT